MQMQALHQPCGPVLPPELPGALSGYGRPPILEWLLEGGLDPAWLCATRTSLSKAKLGGNEWTGHLNMLSSVRPCSSRPLCASVSPPCCHSERNFPHQVPMASLKQLRGGREDRGDTQRSVGERLGCLCSSYSLRGTPPAWESRGGKQVRTSSSARLRRQPWCEP